MCRTAGIIYWHPIAELGQGGTDRVVEAVNNPGDPAIHKGVKAVRIDARILDYPAVRRRKGADDIAYNLYFIIFYHAAPHCNACFAPSVQVKSVKSHSPLSISSTAVPPRISIATTV